MYTKKYVYEQTEEIVPEDQIQSCSNKTLCIHMLFHLSICQELFLHFPITTS